MLTAAFVSSAPMSHIFDLMEFNGNKRKYDLVPAPLALVLWHVRAPAVLADRQVVHAERS